MRIVILSRKARLYSTRRLTQAARHRGHTVRVLDPLDFTMVLSTRNPEIYHRGRTLHPLPDAVIPRIGQSITFYGLAVIDDSRQSFDSVIDAFHAIGQNILIQSFVEEARGEDIRAFVVGRRMVAAMSRKAIEGEFRSNVHRGGSATRLKLSPEYRKAAVAAARRIGLEVAGVDMLASKEGPMIMEVNSSPGLHGIERSTGVDVADAVVAHVERNAHRGGESDRRGR